MGLVAHDPDGPILTYRVSPGVALTFAALALLPPLLLVVIGTSWHRARIIRRHVEEIADRRADAP